MKLDDDDTEKVILPTYGSALLILVKKFNIMIEDGDLIEDGDIGEENGRH